ncbi:MAG: helix-turn-helix domain-containing protein [Clostridia bacterium]|jgi:excisionase family DNA binding protein|nr:helix-turn-helix domain-containing protein [Clostridia bacterium]
MKGVSLNDNILYTVKEVAALLKTNVDYVHKLRKAGLLPFLKLGQYKVRKEALADFLSRYEGKDLTNPFLIKELDYNGEN